jgi:thymidylate synthase (FAD)
MKKVSQITKVDLLDYAPKSSNFGPDRILAAGGILTSEVRDFKEMLEQVDDKVLGGFHNDATRRGHASLTTSVNFYFWLEGSRILDFYFSSFPFGSYLVFSSRRIEVNVENLVVPDSVADSKFNGEYEKICRKLVELYHRVKEESKSIDRARKILPIGFVSRGFFNFPLQVILGIIKDVREDNQKKDPVIPKEIGEIANHFEKYIKSHANYLANASLKLPYNTNFPHPNLFKGDVDFQTPEVKILLKDGDFERLLNEMKNSLETDIDDPKERVKKISGVWKEFVEKIQDKILLDVKIMGTLSIWNDIKRHRSVRQKVESIYHAVERCLKEWDENNFYIPQLKNSETRNEIVNVYKDSLELYNKMVENGIEKRDAIFVIPHGIKLGIRMFLDGYHIFDPFGFVSIRTCSTADHEIVAITNWIIKELEKKVPETEGLIGPKHKLGYCPERNFCDLIKKSVKNYDEKVHSIFQ